MNIHLPKEQHNRNVFSTLMNHSNLQKQRMTGKQMKLPEADVFTNWTIGIKNNYTTQLNQEPMECEMMTLVSRLCRESQAKLHSRRTMTPFPWTSKKHSAAVLISCVVSSQYNPHNSKSILKCEKQNLYLKKLSTTILTSFES